MIDQNLRIVGVSWAARRLGVSEATVRNLVRQKKLPTLRSNTGQRLLCQDDVERLAEQRQSSARG